MTIICAMNKVAINGVGGGTWIAGDTQVTSGDNRIGNKQKWLLGNGWALGIAGSVAVIDLLAAHAAEIQASWSGIALFNWAKGLMIGFGIVPKTEGCDVPEYPCEFLFATPTRLLSIDCTGATVQLADGEFASRGTGCVYADGAAFISAKHNTAPHVILAHAVEAAIKYSTSCGGTYFGTSLPV